MKKLLFVTALLIVMAAGPAAAKEGFYIGAFLPINTVSVDMEEGVDIDSGTGYGLRVGLGLNRYMSIEGTYMASKHDLTGLPAGVASTMDLTVGAVDFKLNFPLTSLDSGDVMTVEPFLKLGYGTYKLSNDGSEKDSGIDFGLGIELYLFRELSVQAGYDNLKGDVTTIEAGLIYHFL